jgi:hypothetical protein
LSNTNYATKLEDVEIDKSVRLIIESLTGGKPFLGFGIAQRLLLFSEDVRINADSRGRSY